LHTFDGIHADAEIVVVHKGSYGGLIVCIPVVGTTNPNASTASVILDEIVKNAPDTGSSTINLQDFNLNYILPKSGFFSYTGSLPFTGCKPGENYNYVVFPRQSISVNKTTLKSLGDIIVNSYTQIHSGKCFWNEKGTLSNGFSGDGQIYIDCQPTGEEGEILYKEDTSTSSNDGFTINMTWVYTILGILIGFLILYYGSKIYNATIQMVGNLGDKKLP
jgi:hypothetical protein